jgi:superfamily II DNA/RNA helicase
MEKKKLQAIGSLYLCPMYIRPKSQDKILKKLGITSLNAMQTEAIEVIKSNPEVLLLSPTGSGKTLAFLLPIISNLQLNQEGVQVLILVPSRELAIQIETVARSMGSGIKINAVYGGRPISRDKQDLKHTPSILIGTPGRVADHMRRGTFELDDIATLILDEYDKSLEVGFEEEMSGIIAGLPFLKQKILTSATSQVEIPKFVRLENLKTLNFLDSNTPSITVKLVTSPQKDKLETLLATLKHIGNEQGIIFCNFKESIARVSTFLTTSNVSHDCYHGGLDQIDRERALIKFRNGTNRIIVSTDLAARGLDIPELGFILHYHLPLKVEEFVHRNGRTARMQATGSAYILLYKQDSLPTYLKNIEETALENNVPITPSEWATILISGGRKDKISKGDIAGLFMKNGGLGKDELGLIELKQECAFVAVHLTKVDYIIEKLNNTKLKKKKVRLSKV